MSDRYPLVMNHPSYQQAVLSRGDIRSTAPGKPARYPPVIVNDPDQEEYHVSRGYVPQRRPVAEPAPAAAATPAIDPRYWPRWETLPSGTRAIVKTPDDYREIFGREFDPAERSARKAAAANPAPAAPQAAVDADELAEFRAWKATQEEKRAAKRATARKNMEKAHAKRREMRAERKG